MVGVLALPDSPGPWPGVLVLHEGPGLDDVQRGRAARLAELGFASFALDYHGGGEWFSDRDAMMVRLEELRADPDRTRSIARAGLDVLRAEPGVDPARLAAIGYCFGGTMALELARDGAELRAVVAFHPDPRTTRPLDARSIVGKVLVCLGSEDPIVPVEHRLAFEEEMRAGSVDWQLHLYGGTAHSFTHVLADAAALPGIAYHPGSARRSWAAMLDLFDETLGVPRPLTMSDAH